MKVTFKIYRSLLVRVLRILDEQMQDLEDNEQGNTEEYKEVEQAYMECLDYLTKLGSKRDKYELSISLEEFIENHPEPEKVPMCVVYLSQHQKKVLENKGRL